MSQLAKIVKKFVIQEDIVTLSPLRIATGYDDGKTDILVLKNKQGQAYIPGSSLAGILRSELSGIYSERLMDVFFGFAADDCQGNQSMLNISDIILKKSKIISRDGVAIDNLTGVGKKGAKYDYEAVERGCEGKLKLEITVRDINVSQQADEQKFIHKDMQDIYSDICATISDLLSNGISVGSLTTKGFGKIRSKKTAKVYAFDFAANDAAENWLEYLQNGKFIFEPFYSANNAAVVKAEDDLYVQVDCQLHSSMLIKEEAFDEQDIENNISAVQMQSKDDYVLPGTSIKGILRNKAMKILMALNKNDEKRAELFLNNFMGYSKENYSQKSRLLVEEVYVKQSDLRAKQQSRNRIDRFTGSTTDSALFSEKPVWQINQGLPIISLKIRCTKCSHQEVGLVLLLIKDLWAGNIFIGSGKSIGRGILIGKYCEIYYHNEHFVIDGTNRFTVQGSKEKLESYVQALVGEMND